MNNGGIVVAPSDIVGSFDTLLIRFEIRRPFGSGVLVCQVPQPLFSYRGYLEDDVVDLEPVAFRGVFVATVQLGNVSCENGLPNPFSRKEFVRFD